MSQQVEANAEQKENVELTNPAQRTPISIVVDNSHVQKKFTLKVGTRKGEVESYTIPMSGGRGESSLFSLLL